MKYLIVFTVLIICSQSQATPIDHTRFEVLPPKARQAVLAVVDDFPYRLPSVSDEIPEDFSMMMTIERLDADLEEVWNAYIKVPPAFVWSGPRVNYAMALDRETQRVYYPDEVSPQFKVGLMFMNYLKFLGKYIVIGLEITGIDHDKKEIEIAYLEGNASRGKQILKFKRVKNKTQINHISLYKSDSFFRDLIIYPIFHRITTGEHHKKMRQLIQGHKKSPL